MSAPIVTEPEKLEAPKSAPTQALAPAEQKSFHTDDRHAVTAIVGIILTIVTAALIGYSYIAYLALSGQ